MFASTDNPTMSQGVTTQDIISKLNRTILSNVSEVDDPFVDIINASKKRDSLIIKDYRGLLYINCFSLKISLKLPQSRSKDSYK